MGIAPKTTILQSHSCTPAPRPSTAEVPFQYSINQLLEQLTRTGNHFANNINLTTALSSMPENFPNSFLSLKPLVPLDLNEYVIGKMLFK